MADLISRAAAIDAIVSATVFPDADCIKDLCQNPANSEDWLGGVCDAINAVEDVDTVDAAPVVHGMWDGYKADYSDWQRNDGKPVFISCCVCNNVVLNNASANWNYCPNCGAKMDATGRDKEVIPWES